MLLYKGSRADEGSQVGMHVYINASTHSIQDFGPEERCSEHVHGVTPECVFAHYYVVGVEDMWQSGCHTYMY